MYALQNLGLTWTLSNTCPYASPLPSTSHVDAHGEVL